MRKYAVITTSSLVLCAASLSVSAAVMLNPPEPEVITRTVIETVEVEVPVEVERVVEVEVPVEVPVERVVTVTQQVPVSSADWLNRWPSSELTTYDEGVLMCGVNAGPAVDIDPAGNQWAYCEPALAKGH